MNTNKYLKDHLEYLHKVLSNVSVKIKEIPGVSVPDYLVVNRFPLECKFSDLEFDGMYYKEPFEGFFLDLDNLYFHISIKETIDTFLKLIISPDMSFENYLNLITLFNYYSDV